MSFSLPSASSEPMSTIFWLEDSGTGLMRIDGSLIHLSPTHREEHLEVPGKKSVGDRYYDKWQLGDIVVEFRYQTTFLCPPDDEACEVTRFEGTMTVTTAAGRKAFAIEGDVGC